MRIVLIGGSGFIGKNLALKLSDLNYDVLIYDRQEPQFYNIDISNKIVYCKGDLSSQDVLEDVLKEDDIVIHLISTSFPNNSNINIYLDAKSNILTGIMLIETCVKRKINKIIFASSGGAIYGPVQSIPIDEHHELNPISSYGIHKLVIEKYLDLAHKLYGINTISLRIANPYGPGQQPFKGQGFISTALASVILNKKVQVWGDGNAIRDYIYIEDVCEAFCKAIEYDGEYSVFNIGSGIGHSINEILENIKGIYNGEINIEYVNQTSAEVGKNILDCSRAAKILNWKSKIDFKYGIQMMFKTWDYRNEVFKF